MQPSGGGKQSGQWGEYLVREYDNKMTGGQGDQQTGGETFRDFRRRQLYGENDGYRGAGAGRTAYGYGQRRPQAGYQGPETGREESSQGKRGQQAKSRGAERRQDGFGGRRPDAEGRAAGFVGRRPGGVAGEGSEGYPAGRRLSEAEGGTEGRSLGPAGRQDGAGGTGLGFAGRQDGAGERPGPAGRQNGAGGGEAGMGGRRPGSSAPGTDAKRPQSPGTGGRNRGFTGGRAESRGGRWDTGAGRQAAGKRTSGRGRASQKARSAGDGRNGRTENTEWTRPPVQDRRPPGYGSGKKPGGGINFLVQGSILAAAGIVVRLIGMVYRIPLARKIGDVGNGYYNAAYSVYSILLIMSSYSLPTAVSKMVSARLAKGQYRTSTRIFRAAMFYATVAGMAGFCALWFGADYFAGEIIKMPYSSYALKSLAPTIWIMAYLGVLRGYFQGHSTMIPTALSQIFEQVVNAVVSIVAATILFDVGVKSNLVFSDTEYSYAFGAAGGAIGTGAGALTALVLFLLLTMAYVPTMRRQARRDRGGRAESYGAISRALFVTIVPIIISSAIYNVSNVVDNSIFGHVMENMGEDGLTASQWGVYMGRYHMLFNIPVAIANSLSSSLIPSLSRAAAERNRRQILSKIGSAIRFSMIIAIPSAVGLTVLAGPVSNLLFAGMDNEMLIRMMAVGSSAVVFFSLSTVSNAILQGINRMRVPIVNSAVSLVLHVAVLYVMLQVFHMGIYSVVYANIVFAAMVCVLNAVSIARYTGYRQEIIRTFLIPCAASAAMGGTAWGIHRLCAEALGNGISTAAAILAAVLVYFVLLILLKGVDEQELRSMPGGTRLLRAARRLHLMRQH